MCEKAIISDHYDGKKNNNQQQQNSSSTATVIIEEQIDGSSCTFDTADCALMFKKFRDVYGNNFGNE